MSDNIFVNEKGELIYVTDYLNTANIEGLENHIVWAFSVKQN